MIPWLLLLFLAQGPAQNPAPSWCAGRSGPEYAALTRIPVRDTWFEVYRVAPGTFAITEPRQSQGTISYLILGEKQALLFDTGMGIGNLKAVTSEMTPLPVTVLNSHTHHDHVGSNWQFSVTGMDTDFTRRNAQGSRDEAQAEIAPGQVCGELPAGFDPKAYETRKWNTGGYRHDGDRIDLGGRAVEIIATPGHTPDAISLLDRTNGLLFTGDTYYKGTIWLFREETDLTAYGESVKRLAALAPNLKMVLGAHGFPVSDPSVLPDLVSAFTTLRSGTIEPASNTGGRARYKIGDIGFLLRANN